MKKLIAAVAVLLSFAVTVPLLAQFPAKGSFASGYMYSYYVPPPSSTPWRPAWSPDGKEIMFSMSGSLWKIRVGETTAYELTHSAGYDSAPAWSPDGRWIAYTSEDQQGVNLMLLNVATGESTPITSGDRLTLDPVWSPDGKTLAYTRNEPAGRTQQFRPAPPLLWTQRRPYSAVVLARRQGDDFGVEPGHYAGFGRNLASALRGRCDVESQTHPARRDSLSH